MLTIAHLENKIQSFENWYDPAMIDKCQNYLMFNIKVPKIHQ